MSCNFCLKSYLWFQIELGLRARSILKSRVWFETKLHSTQFNYHYIFTAWLKSLLVISEFTKNDNWEFQWWCWLCLLEKRAVKNARNPCNVTNQNIIITCKSITIVTAWSFILWQLIRQTKSNSELFSFYKYIILETCALDQQPCAEMLAKGHIKMPVRLLWCNYATFTNFTSQLPVFFPAHNSGAQDSVRGYDWQNATWHEWLSKTGVVSLSNKDCCIPDQMAEQEYWSQKGVDTLSEM